MRSIESFLKNSQNKHHKAHSNIKTDINHSMYYNRSTLAQAGIYHLILILPLYAFLKKYTTKKEQTSQDKITVIIEIFSKISNISQILLGP